ERALSEADANLRAARTGVAQTPYAEAEDGLLDPAQRDKLSKDRASILRRLADRRAELAGGAPIREKDPKPAANPKDGGPVGTDIVEPETEWHRLRLDLERARERLHAVQVTSRAADLSAEAAEKNGHAEMMILDPAYLPTRPDKGRSRVFLVGAIMALL